MGVGKEALQMMANLFKSQESQQIVSYGQELKNKAIENLGEGATEEDISLINSTVDSLGSELAFREHGSMSNDEVVQYLSQGDNEQISQALSNAFLNSDGVTEDGAFSYEEYATLRGDFDLREASSLNNNHGQIVTSATHENLESRSAINNPVSAASYDYNQHTPEEVEALKEGYTKQSYSSKDEFIKDLKASFGDIDVNGFDFDENGNFTRTNPNNGQVDTYSLYKNENGDILFQHDAALTNENGEKAIQTNIYRRENIVATPQLISEDTPDVTDPPVVTDPPKVTDPPVTEPPVTEPPVTEPPVTEPPVTEPPVTEPPVTEPPVTEPPVTEPPVTEPPAPTTCPPLPDIDKDTTPLPTEPATDVEKPDAPSETPTEAPTEAPTMAPTEAPTMAPTEAPVKNPDGEGELDRDDTNINLDDKKGDVETPSTPKPDEPETPSTPDVPEPSVPDETPSTPEVPDTPELPDTGGGDGCQDKGDLDNPGSSIDGKEDVDVASPSDNDSFSIEDELEQAQEEAASEAESAVEELLDSYEEES